MNTMGPGGHEQMDQVSEDRITEHQVDDVFAGQVEDKEDKEKPVTKEM